LTVAMALFGAVVFAEWSDAYRALRVEKFGIRQMPDIFPTKDIVEELRAREVVNYMDVSEGFATREWTFPTDLIQELQEYVATDLLDYMLADYADRSANISVEDFVTKCPDYAQALREWFANENYLFSTCESFDVVGTRFDVYEMRLEGQSVWVIKYIGHSCVDYAILLAQKDSKTYVIGYEYWNCANFTIIPHEQNGETEYYVIEVERDRNGKAYAVSVVYPYVCYDSWEEKEDGKIDWIGEERIYVYNSLEAIEPQYTYINNKEKLAHQVKAYVDGNLWMLAYMDRNRVRIWGDEEVADSMNEIEQMRLLEATGETNYWAYAYAVIDYNNDGKKEVFYRTSDDSNIYLEKQSDGSFRKDYCRLQVDGKGLVVDKIWFVEFEEKVVTFELAHNFYEKDERILVAYINEKGKDTPLLVSRIGHNRMIVVTDEYLWTEPENGFEEKVPLLQMDMPNETEQRRFAERRDKISVEQIQRVVTLWQGEVPFSESLYKMVKEVFRGLAQGEYYEDCWAELEPYMVDTKKDTEEFLGYVKELTDWNSDSYEIPFESEYIWGYKWYEEGNTKNYLVCYYGYGYGGPVAVDWYKVSGGEVSYVETVAESHEDGEFRLILYEGNLYGISTLWRDPWYYSLCGMQVVCFEEKGEWETHTYKLEEDYEWIAVYQYGEIKELFQNYVAYNSVEMIIAMQNEEWYGASSGSEDLTKDEIRMFKNIIYPTFAEDKDLWMLADINNDSVKEYIVCDPFPYNPFHFLIYQNEDGEFRELDIFGENVYDELVGEGAQFWVKERNGLNYVFVLEERGNIARDYVLHIRLIQDGVLTEKAAYLFRADLREVVE